MPEINAISAFSHKNIVRYYNSWVEGGDHDKTDPTTGVSRTIMFLSLTFVLVPPYISTHAGSPILKPNLTLHGDSIFHHLGM